MKWWWTPSSTPRRSDDAIAKRVNDMVTTGAIKPELAQMYERALRAVADGEAVDMVDLLRAATRPARFSKPRD